MLIDRLCLYDVVGFVLTLYVASSVVPIPIGQFCLLGDRSYGLIAYYSVGAPMGGPACAKATTTG